MGAIGICVPPITTTGATEPTMNTETTRRQTLSTPRAAHYFFNLAGRLDRAAGDAWGRGDEAGYRRYLDRAFALRRSMGW